MKAFCRAGNARRSQQALGSVAAAAAMVIGLSSMVVPAMAGQDLPETVVPYAGGPLPAEALSPPAGTIVALQLDPDGSIAAPDALQAAATDETARKVIVLKLPKDASVVDAVSQFDEGTIVKLNAGAAQKAASTANTPLLPTAPTQDTAAVMRMAHGMRLPDSVWDLASRSVVKIRMVPRRTLTAPELAAAETAATGPVYDRIGGLDEGAMLAGGQSPDDGDIIAVQEPAAGEMPPTIRPADTDDRQASYKIVEMPYSGEVLPSLALNPPANVIVKLRAGIDD